LLTKLINTLFKLLFHHDHEVRLDVYQFFGDVEEYWKSTGGVYKVLSCLILSLGDHNSDCLKCVIRQIKSVGSKYISVIAGPLEELSKPSNENLLTQIGNLDDLATAMAVNKLDLRLILDLVFQNEKTDYFWDYFLADVQENQLARPGDYDYSRNYTHSPFWIAILFTKFNILPPPNIQFRHDMAARKKQDAPNAVARRKLTCGYMFCLLPTMGMSDSLFRTAACAAAVRCCLKQTVVQNEMLRGLLEIVSQQMLGSKQIIYQMYKSSYIRSSFEIFGLIVRLKIPGVAESILQEYFDLSIDLLQNSPLKMVKLAILEFLEILLLVFPMGINARLVELRDISREMMLEEEQAIVTNASKIFCQAFRASSKNQAVEFEEYLKTEIEDILKLGQGDQWDTKVSKLSFDTAQSSFL
jgi:hypothetical protein